MFLSAALQHRYGEKVIVRPAIFTDNPQEALTQEIRAIEQEAPGAKRILIDIFSHGEKTYLNFQNKLTAASLVQVFDAATDMDCKFAVNTLACFGGGLMEGMQDELTKNPALKERMALFTQTKGNITNLAAFRSLQRLEGDAILSHYYLHLADGLYKGETYGAAARKADVEAKKHVPNDAEALIGGQKITMKLPLSLLEGYDVHRPRREQEVA